MKLGIMQHLLERPDLESAFAAAAELGFEGIEIRYGPADTALLTDPRHAERIVQLSQQFSLEVPSLCMGCITRTSLIEPPEDVQKGIQMVRDGIALAADVGAKTVLLPFFGDSAIEVEAELVSAISALEEIVPTAEERGVVLGVESMLNFNQQQFLLNHFATSDNLKIYFDTGNALARKLDLPTGIRQLGASAIAGIHYKDVHLAESMPPDFSVNIGKGNVDFRAVTQALRAIGYDGWVILETPPGNDPIANARTNLAHVRSTLAAAAMA